MYEITCQICGKVFQSSFKVKICKECKNRPCEICGKPFEHLWPYDQHTCSKECQKIYLNDPQLKAAREAKKKTSLLMKYGVDNVSKLKDVRDKISLSKKDPEKYTQLVETEKDQDSHKLIRKCIICGQEFEAIGSQTTCRGPHYKKCAVCGKEFEYSHISDNRKTCSEECRAMLRKNTIQSFIKKCAWCGKEFTSTANTAKYCSGPHFMMCVVCGQEFEIDPSQSSDISNLPKTCSEKCKNELKKDTCLQKYGVSIASQSEDSRNLLRQAAFDRLEQRKQTSLARYGYEFYAQSPEGRKRLSKSVSSEDVQNKIRSTNMDRYGVSHSMQSPEFARKHSNSQFSCTAVDGNRVDSKWEALFYNFLVRNNIEFEYNTVSFPVMYKGKTHFVHIDFKVGDMLFEIKGSHLLDGVYDKYGTTVPIDKKIEVYKKNHVVLVTDSEARSLFGKPSSKDSNGLKYLNKCPEPLIGVDINLFDSPSFPFSSDKPACFYKVRVDGERSSLEAFNDEGVRWNMILNRINYAGGFIDAKQILTAMNVTRTCKQPSWFSKALAERIIGQYCNSDTIVDPMAGWGMRHDAALECHRTYIGLDYNKELVDWHQIKGRNITWGDANDFKFNGDCSVFICPPYSDPQTGRCFEDYNFEGFGSSAKALSQCDWLKIIMKNVPNAREYVMVCKIVDDGWQDYIKETIENRSHFGKNNEYIIVVKQSDRNKILQK